MTTDKHIECISDFCGNYKNPGAWADLFERPDGTRYIGLGGDWKFYAANAPQILDETDPHFASFLDACSSHEDLGYAEKHWAGTETTRKE